MLWRKILSSWQYSISIYSRMWESQNLHHLCLITSLWIQFQWIYGLVYYFYYCDHQMIWNESHSRVEMNFQCFTNIILPKPRALDVTTHPPRRGVFSKTPSVELKWISRVPLSSIRHIMRYESLIYIFYRNYRIVLRYIFYTLPKILPSSSLFQTRCWWRWLVMATWEVLLIFKIHGRSVCIPLAGMDGWAEGTDGSLSKAGPTSTRRSSNPSCSRSSNSAISSSWSQMKLVQEHDRLNQTVFDRFGPCIAWNAQGPCIY